MPESRAQSTFEDNVLHDASRRPDSSNLQIQTGTGGPPDEALVSYLCDKTPREEICVQGLEVREEEPCDPGTKVQHWGRHPVWCLGVGHCSPFPKEATSVLVFQEEVRFGFEGLQSGVATVQELSQKFQDLSSKVLLEADCRGFRLMRLQDIRAPELLGVPQVLRPCLACVLLPSSTHPEGGERQEASVPSVEAHHVLAEGSHQLWEGQGH